MNLDRDEVGDGGGGGGGGGGVVGDDIHPEQHLQAFVYHGTSLVVSSLNSVTS